MTMVEGDARVTIEFQLQRREIDFKSTVADTIFYLPFKTVYTGSTDDEVMLERDGLIYRGIEEARLRVLRVTTIEEVWKL